MFLTADQFKALIHREDVNWSGWWDEKHVSCRHSSGVPAYLARIEYPDEGVGEIYRYKGEGWTLESVGWL